MLKFLNILEILLHSLWTWGVGGDIALIIYQYKYLGETDLFFTVWSFTTLCVMLLWFILKIINKYLIERMIRKIEITNEKILNINTDVLENNPFTDYGMDDENNISNIIKGEYDE